ncbi:MAG: hypothetical protein GEU87_04205 [Alphaproteobacteria bacterium]|nr:hypothetical protein [Alphaproteobacteria bacterium]
MIDTEVAFGDEGSRIDIAAFRPGGRGVELVMYEAKHFSNPEIFGERPKVVDQIRRYREILSTPHRASEICKSYHRIVENIAALEGLPRSAPAARAPPHGKRYEVPALARVKPVLERQPRGSSITVIYCVAYSVIFTVTGLLPWAFPRVDRNLSSCSPSAQIPRVGRGQARSASVFLQLTRWNAAVTWRWIDDLLHLTRRQMTRKMASTQCTCHEKAKSHQISDLSHCHGV